GLGSRVEKCRRSATAAPCAQSRQRSPPRTCSSRRRWIFDQFTDARCRLLGLAMFGHAGAIRIAPVVGEAAAGVQGGRVCRAEVMTYTVISVIGMDFYVVEDRIVSQWRL